MARFRRTTANLGQMSRSVYVASPEGLTGKSAVALGLLDALTREVGSVGVFRPLTTATSEDEVDLIVDMLVSQPGIDQTYDEALGVTYDAARDDPDEALHEIVERFGRLSDRSRSMVVLGTDYTDVSTGTELAFNAQIAANLGLTGGAGRARSRAHARSRSGPRPTRARRAAAPTTPSRSR